MKIILTSNVKDKLKALTLLDTEVSGFIRGSRIGKFLFVTDFLQSDLNKKNIDSQFKKIYKLWGIFLQGVFFKKENFFDSYVFSEKLVMLLENNCWETYYREIDKNRLKLLNKKFFCIEG